MEALMEGVNEGVIFCSHVVEVEEKKEAQREEAYRLVREHGEAL